MKKLLTPFILFLLLSLNNAVLAQGGPLLNIPLPTLEEGQEMLVLEVDMAPGHSSPPHRHNAFVFVYVLEGLVHMQVAGGELQTLGPGEVFFENPDDIHAVSANASDTEPAKILVHMLKKIGVAPSTPVEP